MQITFCVQIYKKLRADGFAPGTAISCARRAYLANRSKHSA